MAAFKDDLRLAPGQAPSDAGRVLNEAPLRAYIVGNNSLAKTQRKLSYFTAPNERHAEARVKFGACVVGHVLEQAEYLQVPFDGLLLPFSISVGALGCFTVLHEIRGARIYMVDNSQLQSQREGVNYRTAANEQPESRNRKLLARYGTLVGGIPHDDSWIRVGQHFLPFYCSGHKVLVPIMDYAPSEPGWLTKLLSGRFQRRSEESEALSRSGRASWFRSKALVREAQTVTEEVPPPLSHKVSTLGPLPSEQPTESSASTPRGRLGRFSLRSQRSAVSSQASGTETITETELVDFDRDHGDAAESDQEH